MMKSRGKLTQCIQRIASGCLSARRMEGWASPSGRGMLASIDVCSGVLRSYPILAGRGLPGRLHGEFTPSQYRGGCRRSKVTYLRGSITSASNSAISGIAAHEWPGERIRR
jgi:hypothetical protein